MGKAADNERKKLQANMLNNVAVGLFLAGCFVPAFAFYTDPGRLENAGAWLAIIVAMVAGAAFHLYAYHILGRIEE